MHKYSSSLLVNFQLPSAFCLMLLKTAATVARMLLPLASRPPSLSSAKKQLSVGASANGCGRFLSELEPSDCYPAEFVSFLPFSGLQRAADSGGMLQQAGRQADSDSGFLGVTCASSHSPLQCAECCVRPPGAPFNHRRALCYLVACVLKSRVLLLLSVQVLHTIPSSFFALFFPACAACSHINL